MKTLKKVVQEAIERKLNSFDLEYLVSEAIDEGQIQEALIRAMEEKVSDLIDEAVMEWVDDMD